MDDQYKIDPDASPWLWLAYDLRLHRTKAGLSQPQMAKILHRSPSGISNIEAGRRRLTEKDVVALDRHFSTGGHFQRLLRFARLSHNPDWFKEHLGYEARASVIKIWELGWIPGLFQTPDYARASITASGVNGIDALVETRISRQTLLTSTDAPMIWAIVDQALLLRHVGGRKVITDQLSRLLELSELPNISIRVVPLDVGAHMGQDGSFKLMHVKGTDVAYVDAPAGGRLILDPEEVTATGLRFDRIGAMALPEPLSRDLVDQARKDMA